MPRRWQRFSRAVILYIVCTMKSLGSFKKYWCLGLTSRDANLIGPWCSLSTGVFKKLPYWFNCAVKVENHWRRGKESHAQRSPKKTFTDQDNPINPQVQLSLFCLDFVALHFVISFLQSTKFCCSLKAMVTEKND